MKVLHLYTGPDGRSHFADLELRLTPGPGGSYVELDAAVRSVVIREVAPGLDAGWHNAPRRQLVVQLSGRGELVCGDGSRRVVGPGDVLLADDLTGEGHRSRELEGPRRQAVLLLDADFDLGALTEP